MDVDPTRMCELLVGLPDVVVMGVADVSGAALRVHVELRTAGRGCGGCSGVARVTERPEVGRPAGVRPSGPAGLAQAPVGVREGRLPVMSRTVEDPAIAAPRLALTERAGRWVTEQVGRWRRTVNEVAIELGCDWAHDQRRGDRLGTRSGRQPGQDRPAQRLGLDETLLCRQGRWRRQLWSTSIVDVATGRLLDVVAGRSAADPCRWLASEATSGASASGGRRWTCPVPIAWCSTRCCQRPPRSRPGRRLGRATRPRPPGRVVSDRGPRSVARSSAGSVRSDHGLAPSASEQRPRRGGQQLIKPAPLRSNLTRAFETVGRRDAARCSHAPVQVDYRRGVIPPELGC